MAGVRRACLGAALALAVLAWSGSIQAASPQPPAVQPQAPAAPNSPVNSGLGGELLYQLLISELQITQGQPGAGFSLTLDAARKSRRPELFQRAIQIALQARSGESALQASRAWTEALPRSADAQRMVLQLVLALDRPADLAPPLRSLLHLLPVAERAPLILALPQMLTRLSDKAAALKAVTPLLQEAGQQPARAMAAWASLGRLQLAAGQKTQALESAQKAMLKDHRSALPAWLGLALIEQGQAGADALVLRWLERDNGEDTTRLRLEYTRLLIEQRRPSEARTQLDLLTREQASLAQVWLLDGLLYLQLEQLEPATDSLQRYLTLPASEAGHNGRTQARLLLSQIAEKQGRLEDALAWLDRIEDTETQATVQSRRALLLARAGRLDEARAQLRGLPAENPADERRKLVAEAQLLRELEHYAEALSVYEEATQRFPQDADLAYERAMVAEKAGRTEEMERLLRELIARAPDYGHAYNALGYSLADRDQDLEQARELIRRAVALIPDDPFIQDSLGWVEFRLGNLTEARRVLRMAFERRADPEIAAHLGEVLWTEGEHEAALTVWRQGLRLQADNDTLLRTLQRLRVKP
ncbi:MAG: hypothetical protein RLZZ22_1060 [Pseudomonadota bacterium]|jgi:tetratricopeptide (TPR) repeat protein